MFSIEYGSQYIVPLFFEFQVYFTSSLLYSHISNSFLFSTHLYQPKVLDESYSDSFLVSWTIPLKISKGALGHFLKGSFPFPAHLKDYFSELLHEAWFLSKLSW